jgi:hypothetical protein
MCADRARERKRSDYFHALIRLADVDDPDNGSYGRQPSICRNVGNVLSKP